MERTRRKTLVLFAPKQMGLRRSSALPLRLTPCVLRTATIKPLSICRADSGRNHDGAWASAAHFGDGAMTAESLASNLVGAVVKDPVQDTVALQEYLESVMRTRDGWSDLYSAIREVL